MKKIPGTCFSTSLIGSAGEIEARLRALFQGAKKRPPVLVLLALMLGVGLCGNLVSCQQSQAAGVPAEPSLQDLVKRTPQPEPEGSVDPADAYASLRAAVEEAGFSVEDEPVESRTLLGTEGCTLKTAVFPAGMQDSILALGVSGPDGDLNGNAFITTQRGGQTHSTTWSKDGIQYFLYTNNGLSQGYSGGDAGLVAFDGTDIRWLWPVEGDLRDSESAACEAYWSYWESHKALLCQGGVEIFQANPDYGPYDGSPVQWEPENSEILYSGGELYIGVMWKVRTWLEEFSRNENNPYDGVNTSAAWCITRLRWLEQEENGAGTYQLTAQADYDSQICLSAMLTLDEDHEVTVQSWQIGGPEQLAQTVAEKMDESPEVHTLPWIEHQDSAPPFSLSITEP